MSIEVEISPFLRKYVPGYDPAKGIVLKQASGKTVKNIIEELGIPSDKVNSIMINHRPAKSDHVVEEGDKVGLIMALGGG